MTLRQFQWRAIANNLARGGNLATRRFSSERNNAWSTSSALPTSVTLLTPDPSRFTPQSLVSRLPILPYTPETKNVAPVFLISSALAPWLCDSPSLSQRLVGHIFGGLKGESGVTDTVDIDAIFAVVDKVPFPFSAGADHQTTVADSRAQGFQQRGCEGLSMLLSRRDALFGSVVPPPSRRRDAATAEPESTLLYETITPLPDTDKSLSNRVSIPVANTVFTTGEPRTLLATRWRFTPEAERRPPSLQATHNLGRCRVATASKESTSYPFVPVDAITRARKVVTSMGNVVSQLSGDDGTKQIPPSAELEKTLPEYVERHNLGHQRLAVWALVVPGGSEDTAKPASCSDLSTSDLSELLKKGARLHRVMGGGGGWGKKQGLLSLDPEDGTQPDDSAPTERPIQDLLGNEPEEKPFPSTVNDLFSLLESEKEDLSTAMAAVAQPDDSMQFFVASLEKPDVSSLKYSLAPGSQTRVFGVIPATDIPTPSEEREERAPSGTEDDITVVPNHFGALSDKSVTWSSFEHSYGPEKTSRRSLGTDQRVSGTKIDVPGARVIIS